MGERVDDPYFGEKSEEKKLVLNHGAKKMLLCFIVFRSASTIKIQMFMGEEGVLHCTKSPFEAD